jgi:anti-sigma B factor antagonist
MILQFSRRELAPGVAVLAIQGNVHCGPECARLEREVDGLLKDKFIRVVLDLKGVSHMDSAAIGAIVRCHAKLKAAGGALRIASVQPMIAHSLQLTKVDRIISVYSGVSEAAQNFASSGGANPA